MAITRSHPAGEEYGARVSTMNAIDWIAMALLIVGGINWGLIGLFGFDLVAALFGEMSPISRLVYILVGAAALLCLYTSTKLMRNNTAR